VQLQWQASTSLCGRVTGLSPVTSTVVEAVYGWPGEVIYGTVRRLTDDSMMAMFG
jgi:hypothetical protein